MLDHEKCETALYKKNTIINELRAKIQKMEIDQRHREKMNLLKRNQIEEEKIKLRQDCASKTRSITKSNISATRAQQVIESKQAVINIERDNKRALQQELSRLQQEMNVLRRERDLF